MPADQNLLPSLKRFAYLGIFPDRLAELAALAEPEDWEYQSISPGYSRPILYSYIIHTFERLEEEGKIAYTSDGRQCTFNTGLVTVNQEPIFALFEANKIPDKQAWYLKGFLRKGDFRLGSFGALPDMAHYFDDPAGLIFDRRLELRPNVEHMIADNKPRFPSPYSAQTDFQLQNTLKGAIGNATERVARNYKAAVPQYHKGRIQLLLPLCLSAPGKADLAIVVEKMEEGYYRAATCLTLDMAYNNARLLARPDRDWLQP